MSGTRQKCPKCNVIVIAKKKGGLQRHRARGGQWCGEEPQVQKEEKPQWRNIITIYTDASHHFESKQGGWACWIKYGTGLTTQASGAFKDSVLCSTEAELKAIANALHVVRVTIKPDPSLLVIVTDSANAISNISGPSLQKKRPKSKRLWTIGEQINKILPHCTIRMRKVKAHSKSDGARSYVNNLVDKASRSAMRNKIKQLAK